MYKWSLNSTNESDRFPQGYSAPTNACIQKIPRSLSLEKVLQKLPQRSRSPTYDQDYESSRPLCIITKTTAFPPREKTTSSAIEKTTAFPLIWGHHTMCELLAAHTMIIEARWVCNWTVDIIIKVSLKLRLLPTMGLTGGHGAQNSEGGQSVGRFGAVP